MGWFQDWKDRRAATKQAAKDRRAGESPSFKDRRAGENIADEVLSLTQSGQVDKLRDLLESVSIGARAYAINRTQDTNGKDITPPIFYAYKTPAILRVLLNNGADINIIMQTHANVALTETLLNYAIRFGDIEDVKRLLENGADPNIPGYPTRDGPKGFKGGNTALHVVAEEQYSNAAELVALLLNNPGKPANPNARNNMGNTPLDVARAREPRYSEDDEYVRVKRTVCQMLQEADQLAKAEEELQNALSQPDHTVESVELTATEQAELRAMEERIKSGEVDANKKPPVRGITTRTERDDNNQTVFLRR